MGPITRDACGMVGAMQKQACNSITYSPASQLLSFSSTYLTTRLYVGRRLFGRPPGRYHPQVEKTFFFFSFVSMCNPKKTFRHPQTYFRPCIFFFFFFLVWTTTWRTGSFCTSLIVRTCITHRFSYGLPTIFIISSPALLYPGLIKQLNMLDTTSTPPAFER